MNPHDTNVTRSLVLLVCQFRHFRILYITQPFSLSMPTTNDMILWHKENVNNYFGKSKSPKIASVFLKFLNIPSVRFRFASSHCRLSHYASPCPVRFRFASSHCGLSALCRSRKDDSRKQVSAPSFPASAHRGTANRHSTHPDICRRFV